MQELRTNFKNKYGQTIPLPKIYQDEDSSEDEGLALGDGTRYRKKTMGGGGSKGSGGQGGGGQGGGHTGGNGNADPKPGPLQGRGGGTGGRQPGKRGHDDNDDDDPNKCRKTEGEGKPPRPTVAHKEPRKSGTAYPPINRNLPPLYISCRKERTRLGHHILDWTPAQKRSIHEARMQVRLVKPHRYRVGTAALKDIHHFQKSTALLIRKLPFPEVGEGDRPRLQNRSAVPVSGDTMSSRSSRSLSCRAVRRHQPVHAIHAKRVTIMPKDIQLARRI